MLLSLFLVVVGAALLFLGGEVLVDNSIQLAKSAGVSSLVIGLTVVAFATSAPELAATITAALKDSPDMAIGNVLGSNIANLGLILGVSALIFPLHATARFIRREVAFMVFVTILVYPLMATGRQLEWLEGLFLVVMLGIFLWTQLRETRGEKEGTDSRQEGDGDEDGETLRPAWRSALGVALGVALLVGGAWSLVTGASDVARSMGVSERVIGLTLVALGTSLPELAAAISAARRHEGDLVLGNVIGSNIFNLLCILGFTAMVSPIRVASKAIGLDYWVVLAISVLVMLGLATQRRLVRLEGAILLAFYLGYMIFLYQA